MPEVTLRHDIDTDEDTFWEKVVLDEGFNKKMYEGELKFPAWKLLEMKEDGDKVTRRVQVEPSVGNLPGPLKKVIGDKLVYVEEGTFDRKAKRYTYKVHPSVMPEKTKILGELWTEKLGDKKVRRHFKINVEVKVFAIGGMVEDRILADLKSSYENSTAFTNRYIKEHGL